MPPQQKKAFYISTPLYYVNAPPHLGTAFSCVLADVFTRYGQLFGWEVFFQTGTDEHGQKCAQAAKEKGLPPSAYCREMREQFRKTWDQLNIKYHPIGEDGSFFYTSHRYKDPSDQLFDHTGIVQSLLTKLKAKGDIYPADYKGWYCVSEEIFYTEKDLKEGRAPSRKELIPLREKAWFFNMSKYQEALIRHIRQNPGFIHPLSRQNEILSFLKQPLRDLCLSRPKSRVSWGIELPFDKTCVLYVWLDALLNYITGPGFAAKEEKDRQDFEKYWETGESIHLIGKDILMTHAVYWPCLLMALGITLPKRILAHGWLLNKEAEKMSKSKGDILDPIYLSELVGLCGLRYFLCREMLLERDMAVSKSLIVKRLNEDLANGIGNLFSRVCQLIEKGFEGKVPVPVPLPVSVSSEKGGKAEFFQKAVFDLREGLELKVKNFEFSSALQAIFSVLEELNRYLEHSAPWKNLKLTKSQTKAQAENQRAKNQTEDQTGVVLYNSLETLRICAILLFPVMPDKMGLLLSELGCEPKFELARWGAFPFTKRIRKTSPLFPKIKDFN